MNILSSVPFILPITIIIIAIILAVFVITRFYKVAPPNVAMVVTGPRGAKTVVGKGKFVIPIIQKVSYLSLENISVDFQSRDEIPTHDAINILVDAIANVAVSTDPDRLQVAASKFLGRNNDYIRETVIPVLEGNTREIISQMTLKEVIQGDKKIFAEKVIDNVEENLHALGLDLITFNIQNFKDKNGVIDNLGMENIAQITKDAAIAKANANKEVEIAEAKAKQESNEARVASETEVAKRQNELAIQKAELKRESDTKKAEAEAAYDIQAQEQRKTVEIKTADANLARQEKEIELKEREVTIKERQLEAEVKKTAEAEKYAAQQRADAQLYSTQKESDAELYERAKKAEAEQIEAERKAEAQKALAEAIKAQGLAEAEAARAKGEAEAQAIQAKLEAEAEGLNKKADSMAKYGDAAKQDMQLQALKVYFEQLPEIAKAAGEAYTNVDKIVMLGGESSKLSGDIINNITQVSEGLGQTLGIDLKSLLVGIFGDRMLSKDNATPTQNVDPGFDIPVSTTTFSELDGSEDK